MGATPDCALYRGKGFYPSSSLRSAGRRQRYGLDLGQIELAGGVVDIEADNAAIGVKVHDQAVDNLARLRARRAGELDVEAIRLRVIMQLHRSASRKLRSKNALWRVSPSSSVTTRVDLPIPQFCPRSECGRPFGLRAGSGRRVRPGTIGAGYMAPCAARAPRDGGGS